MSEQPDWRRALTAAMGAPLVVTEIGGGETLVEAPAERLLALVAALREAYVELHLTAITGMYVAGQVVLLYHLFTGRGLTLRLHCSGQAPSIASLTPTWPAADWYEREIHDLLGVAFDGHPNLAPLLLSPQWDGPPPLRPQEDSS